MTMVYVPNRFCVVAVPTWRARGLRAESTKIMISDLSENEDVGENRWLFIIGVFLQFFIPFQKVDPHSEFSNKRSFVKNRPNS